MSEEESLPTAAKVWRSPDIKFEVAGYGHDHLTEGDELVRRKDIAELFEGYMTAFLSASTFEERKRIYEQILERIEQKNAEGENQ